MPCYCSTFNKPGRKYEAKSDSETDDFGYTKRSYPKSDNSGMSSQKYSSTLDDQAWNDLNILRQKACKFITSEMDDTPTDQQGCHCHNDFRREGSNLLRRANDLIDYTPESEFLKRMKYQCQLLAENKHNMFSALDKGLESSSGGNSYRPREVPKGEEQLKFISPVRERPRMAKYNPEMVCQNSSSGPPCSTDEKFLDHLIDKKLPSDQNIRGSNKKSEHVSRSKKPSKCRGRRKRKSGSAGKCESENQFEPTLKKPHENSCERCWRYASPSRSPVNRPDQRYDPNFRRGHSCYDFESGDGEFYDRHVSPCKNLQPITSREKQRSAETVDNFTQKVVKPISAAWQRSPEAQPQTSFPTRQKSAETRPQTSFPARQKSAETRPQTSFPARQKSAETRPQTPGPVRQKCGCRVARPQTAPTWEPQRVWSKEGQPVSFALENSTEDQFHTSWQKPPQSQSPILSSLYWKSPEVQFQKPPVQHDLPFSPGWECSTEDQAQNYSMWQRATDNKVQRPPTPCRRPQFQTPPCCSRYNEDIPISPNWESSGECQARTSHSIWQRLPEAQMPSCVSPRTPQTQMPSSVDRRTPQAQMASYVGQRSPQAQMPSSVGPRSPRMLQPTAVPQGVLHPESSGRPRPDISPTDIKRCSDGIHGLNLTDCKAFPSRPREDVREITNTSLPPRQVSPSAMGENIYSPRQFSPPRPCPLSLGTISEAAGSESSKRSKSPKKNRTIKSQVSTPSTAKSPKSPARQESPRVDSAGRGQGSPPKKKTPQKSTGGSPSNKTLKSPNRSGNGSSKKCKPKSPPKPGSNAQKAERSPVNFPERSPNERSPASFPERSPNERSPVSFPERSPNERSPASFLARSPNERSVRSPQISPSAAPQRIESSAAISSAQSCGPGRSPQTWEPPARPAVIGKDGEIWASPRRVPRQRQMAADHGVIECSCGPPGSCVPKNNQGHFVMCCHCNWENPEIRPSRSRNKNVNGYDGRAYICPHKKAAYLLDEQPLASPVGSSFERDCRLLSELQNTPSFQSTFQGMSRIFPAPREYFLFYMTKSKENKQDDEVEVLVEELTNKTDSRSKDLAEKMKKIMECPSDSMALKFQKGVSDQCRIPQSSRTLYF